MTKRTAPKKTNGKKNQDDKKINHDFLTVGIGASAGGIGALKQFFAAMPAENGMAFVVILHLSDEHESSLAHILQGQTKMKVEQVTETVKVEPNNVYVIPPAKGLAMVDGHIQLTEPEHIKGKRVPIDLFFRTLADAYGKNGIAVVLSGTGSDGTLGLKRVKENGGIGIAQEPSEAEYDGMPRSAINTGLVDLILPVGEMPARIIGLRDNGDKIRLPQEKDEILPPSKGKEPDALNEILAIVRVRTGHDFSSYKHATVLRRIARRLQVHGFGELPEYLEYLRGNADEAGQLQRDLLITVTNFFRDKEAFEALEKEIIPKLFAGKTSADTVRVWSVGCATGEEVYSLAILLDEYASRITNAPNIQIFASDINEEAIAKGRDCFYDEPIVADVSPERLRHFFAKENGGWRVRKKLREMVLFAPHNILRDPPFSKLDLITCRNLLIYFNRETQEKVLGIFNFALRRDGYLFLGASESAESLSALFSVVDKKQRLYKARPAAHFQPLPAMPEHGKWNIRIPQLPTETSDEPPISYGEIHYKLVEQFAPPSVLVNEDYEIVHVSEHAGRFLRVAGGEPTRDLLKMIHPSLKLDLQSALFEVKKGSFVSESRNVRFARDEGRGQRDESEKDDSDLFIPHPSSFIPSTESLVNITVRLVQTPDTADGFYLVIFDESKSEAAPVEVGGQQMQTIGGRDALGIVAQLEKELQISRERLRATIEQNETSHEELKASNEELQAINEELRSASEELETGKEELQSLNEELMTVNAELKDKVDETIRVNSDLQNLVQSTDIGTIFLDRALKVKRFTPRVAELFNVIPSDIGRPLEHITHKLDYDLLTEDAQEVLRTLHLKEREVRGGAGDSRYLVRIAPYRTIDDKIDGVVLSFQDITKLKRAGDLLLESEEQYQTLFNSIDEGFCIIEMLFDDDGKANDWRFLKVNPVFEKHNGLVGATGKTILELVPNIETKWFEIYGKVAATGEANRFTENSAALNRWFDLYAFRVGGDDSRKVAVLFTNITERRQITEALQASEEKLKDADRRKDEFLATLAHELRNPLAPIRTALEIMRRSDDKETARKARNRIERQFAHIVRLVDDLLDVSRISQGKIKLQMTRIKLQAAIEMAVETTRPAIESGGHELEINLPDEPIYLNADPIRLSQIFLNLLTNAAKYSEPNGKISIIAKREKNQIVVCVKDSGFGIEPDKLPHIFGMFTQIERSAQRGQGGLGIGLSLVKNLTEMHGGTIEAESAGEGKGCTFTVRLPLAKNQRQLAGAVGSKKQKSAKEIVSTKSESRKILAVDDNADSLEMMEILLTLDGHQVRTALNGETALKIAPEFQPEVCILDIGLPGMNGYELARRLHETMPQVLLIALSGWGQDEDRRRSKEAGFDHHLVKPVEPQKLEDLLTKQSRLK